ncbi:MAG: MFS transporter [Deltaproteobacteria bacterium]|nr:MFS transporter [Myxococcales bacterium]MDP3219799.1 MFS transporter [Deltaproteobacteria bacterium]
MKPDALPGEVIRTDIPARLDALTWSRWHRRVVVALGITWILDGLEASLIANLAPTLQDARTLGLRAAEVGLANTVYLVGQVLGALIFGHLTDRFGRKRLFLVTLGIYLGATAASGAASSFGVFLLFRLLAGAGIGGEYSAINSAIDELIPARIRGQIDLGINGSYWIGVALGAVLTLVLLDPARVPVELGWRLVFGLGAVMGLVILLVRRDVPESPRWLLMHGYVREAHATMEVIEARVREGGATIVRVTRQMEVALTVTGTVGAGHVLRVLLRRHPRRAALGVVMMIAQAFFYNAIFFSYGLILQRFHHVRADRVGLYVLPFAAGNFLGPLLLGPLFDRWGRRVMIPATYAISGVLLVVTGALFFAGALDAVTQTVAWSVVFFFASAAASSAYLTVSELFPVEIRGVAIALFYAIGTGGGAFAPSLFARIVEGGDPGRLFAGYALASTLMLIAAVVARRLGVASEGRSLEELTREDA